ncbi:phage structural protein [Shouchella lehensis]|uniref:DUF3277 family protein n=1 Tax=Shouchella lehensis TaxID=300825 RepID=A0A4Y7WDW7_9BACI|nr:phage protein [Shouchella lehensis]MBG9783587.1 hypothetical protein [Shouchella lehensis]TES45656.1 DUF3277 family protein [Shouchella lehensis]
MIYDPNNISVIIDNVFVTGFAEGTMVSAAKDEENFQTKVSAKGEVSVALSNNPLGTITVTLSADSPHVKRLSNLANTKAMVSAWVNASAPVKEKKGGSRAMVKKPADAEFSDEVGDREFEIQVFDYTDS